MCSSDLKSKYKLTEMKEEKMSNGDNTVTYTLMSEDGEEQIDTIVNIDNLEQEHLKITAKDIEEDRENGYQLIIEDK